MFIEAPRRARLPKFQQIVAAGVVALSLLLCLMIPRAAAAQYPAPGMSGDPADLIPSPAFTDPDSLRNIRGHVTFIRYLTPGQCLGAVILAQKELVHDPGVDTLFGPASIRDPFSPQVREMGMRCLTQIAARPVSQRHLQNVFTLATLLSDTIGGDAARARWFASPQTLEDRGETPAETRAKRIDTAIISYMHDSVAGPMRRPYGARAHALFAELDAMGQPVRSQRLAMQARLLTMETRWATQETGRVPDPQRQFQGWLTWLAGVDSAGGLMIPGPGDYGASALGPVQSLLSARFLLDRNSIVQFADSIVKAMPKSQGINAFLLLVAHDMTDGMGNAVPQLHGSKWYNAGRDTVWPIPGQFSLLVDSQLTPRQTAMLRRISARYSPQGLRLLLVLKTMGYWDMYGTETGPRTAAQEMAQDSAFYLGYRKLPVMLTVQEATFQQLSNGWWQQAAPVQYERDWSTGKAGYGPGLRMVMVDSTGKLFSKLSLDDEARVYAFIDMMMGIDTPNTTPPTAHPASRSK